jgi:hypothetical protein
VKLALAAVAALVALAPAPAPLLAEPLAGLYRLEGVREAAGALELSADGRFRYALAYGALDERAEGRWRREGARILLSTEPRPRPPVFALAEVTRGPPGSFGVLVVGPDGEPIPNLTITVTLSDGSSDTAQSSRDWLEGELPQGLQPVSLSVHIPLFDVHSDAFAIDLAKGNRMRISLDPADLGVRDFRDEALEIRDDGLGFPGGEPGRWAREQER